MKRGIPDVQAGFRKGDEPEIQLPTSVGSSKKQASSRKKSTSALLTMPKPLTLEKFLKRWESQTTRPASWEICMQAKKQQLVLDMEQQTGSKSGKEYIKAVWCPPVYFIMRNAGLDEAQAGIKISRRNINNLRYADGTTLMVESKEELKSLLMKVKREEWKSWHKSQHSEN